ncbi:hypothetical protein QVD17_16123 [Tagetes erecta]|uniref:Uncharacterized protein n=1 Tax=Tagetes erecta TaxID=13708 RepID=A0AAD8KW74_TARER|nr:hypothetical protein QVD17_16123 [Tagetes erecta]
MCKHDFVYFLVPDRNTIEAMEAPECPVCLQSFDHKSTIPRVLACGHSVCETCLINLPKPPFPRTIRCPACTQLVTYPHPQGPFALPKNIDLLRIISSSSSSFPKSNPKPKTPNSSFQDFIPNLWSHEFFSNWKDWVLSQDTVLLDTSVDGSVSHGKVVNLKVPTNCLMKCLKRNQKVSLFKLGFYRGNDEDRFRFGYLAKAMWVLCKMGDGVLGEIELILRASLMEYRICSACGLWYNEDDDNLYMVCEKRETSLLDVVVVYDVEVGMSSFAMIGMELCETVSQLHDVELVIGCTSLSCFGVDEFGHVFIDLNEVMVVGGRLQKLLIEFAQNDDIKRLVMDAFPSPELLMQFVHKQGVDLESTCVVGYGSDLWSLGCILLGFLVGKSFVEETTDFLSSYTLKLFNGNACDCEGLHAAWLDKISGLLDSRLDSGYESLKKLLCKCLSYDPGSRPFVSDIWKCMRELIISPKFDVTVSMERKPARGSTCHCLLLGDLLWSQYKTNKVDDKKGMMNNLTDETLVVGNDLIEGVCKNSLTCTDLKGHLDCISGLAIGGGFLFSSSFDKTINVWSLQDLNLVHTFKGHEHKVMALVFVESEIPLCISGDNGGEIFIWGIKLPFEEKPFKRLNEEKDWRYSGIHALAADSRSGIFYTGSGDKSVKAWSMHDDYSLSCTMNGHKSVVCTLAVSDGVLYSGSWDGTIRLWSLNDHSPLAVLGEEAPCGSVLSLVAHTNTLVAAHENGRIKIWNKDVPLTPMSTHSSSIFSVYIEGQWLFSGGWNKTVVVQKLTSGDESQLDVTEIGSVAGDSVVTALHYWQGRLFVGHADRTIKVYSAGG